MIEVDTPGALGEIVREARGAGQSIGLVPTMGYLHQGHLRLADVARAENDLVIMSIFINPTQFGPQEDLDRYPRDVARDRQLAAEHSVDALFLPSVSAMYPGGPQVQTVWVEPGPLAAYLCGPSRPGHFRGVATVVGKLFHMAQPDRAYFGQKDAQQAMIVDRMVRDLAFPLEIRVIPTVREADGLALSSRNVYLSPEERMQAVALSQALGLARSAIAHGERRARAIEDAMRELITHTAPLGRIDYVTVADLSTLQPVPDEIDGDVLIALAVYFGATRLIDNTIVRFSGRMPSFP